MSDLERVGVSLDKNLLQQFDTLIEGLGYTNRSEAIRDLIRDRLASQQISDPDAHAIAGVFIVYDHHITRLSQQLVDLQHNHFVHVIVTTHIHLDHHNCLEVIILKGQVGQIEKLANAIASLKGVKLSQINLMPGEVEI